MRDPIRPLHRAAGSYPKPLSYRSGNKVSWLTFATVEDAKACAAVAQDDAVRLEAYGYDFGFCVPGEITDLEDGKWEVCIP